MENDSTWLLGLAAGLREREAQAEARWTGNPFSSTLGAVWQSGYATGCDLRELLESRGAEGAVAADG